MDLILLTFALCSIVPWVLYLGQGGGLGPSWGVIAAGERVFGTGAYRKQTVTRWKRGAAPLLVRVTAFSCFYLGQMVVPGAFAALAGIAVVFDASRASPVWVVIELSAPTGLIVAALLLDAGWSLLEGDPAAGHRARRAARWSVTHNLVLLACLGVAVACDAPESASALFPCVYACVSLAQAALVVRAGAAADAYHAARRAAPAPLHEEDAALAGTG